MADTPQPRQAPLLPGSPTDPARAKPINLEALYEHWRPDAGWQREGEALLEHSSVYPRDVLRLEPSSDDTRALPATAQEIELLAAGDNVAEAMVRRMPPTQFDPLKAYMTKGDQMGCLWKQGLFAGANP